MRNAGSQCSPDKPGRYICGLHVLNKDNDGHIHHSKTQEGKRKPRAAGSSRALVQKKRAGSRLWHLVGLGGTDPVLAPAAGRVPVGIRQVPVRHPIDLQAVDRRLV